MNKQTGGQAFPRNADQIDDGAEGMTLRDYFAAKVLQGLCANPGGPFQANDMNGWALVNCDNDNIASVSYSLADAMLKAREASCD